MEYSLGLYEKAIPVGFSFPKMFEITRDCGFDRLEISVDETDWRLERLDWSTEKQRELGVLLNPLPGRGGTDPHHVSVRPPQISLRIP